MGFLSRLLSLGKGKANDKMDSLENANMDTVIRQTQREMQEELDRTIKASAEAMASANQIERQYNDLKAKKKDWEGKAKLAVEEENDKLAMKALEMVEQTEAEMKTLEPSVKQSKSACAALKKKVEQFKAKINKAKTEGKTLIARNEAAKAQKSLAAAASGMGSSDSAFAKMERFKERVESNEAEANAYDELSGDPDEDLEAEFAALGSASAADKLAELKAKMNKD